MKRLSVDHIIHNHSAAQDDYKWITPYKPDWLNLIQHNEVPLNTILENMRNIRRVNGINCPVDYAESLVEGTRSLHNLVQTILTNIFLFDDWVSDQLEGGEITDKDFFDDAEMVSEQLTGNADVIREFEQQMTTGARWLTRIPSSNIPYTDVINNRWLLACNIVKCEYFDRLGRKLDGVPANQAKMYDVEFDERTQAQTVNTFRVIVLNLEEAAKVVGDLVEWVKSLNLREDMARRWPRLFNFDANLTDDNGNPLPRSDFPELQEWILCRLGILPDILEVLESIPPYQETLVETHP
ncbi:hypothetical protein Dda_8360 [Drechslerella dactyloides]|uniref:Uncharacterized protein n=1 Tax=Drechslerella dactyloides TaxID=74499 RepID=A0AAD6IQE8_DREDA|nr:hypothetical protein Dda_8360 [Drechslerella dactyloides]